MRLLPVIAGDIVLSLVDRNCDLSHGIFLLLPVPSRSALVANQGLDPIDRTVQAPGNLVITGFQGRNLLARRAQLFRQVTDVAVAVILAALGGFCLNGRFEPREGFFDTRISFISARRGIGFFVRQGVVRSSSCSFRLGVLGRKRQPALRSKLIVDGGGLTVDCAPALTCC